MRVILGVRQWLIGGTLVIAGAAAAGTAAGNYAAHRQEPIPETKACADAARISIGATMGTVECDPRARLDVKPLSGSGTDTMTLFRCTCSRHETDAGADAPAERIVP